MSDDLDFLAREAQVLGNDASALFGDEPLFPTSPVSQVPAAKEEDLFPDFPMTETITSPQVVPLVEKESEASLNFKEHFKTLIAERDQKSKSKHDLILKNAKNSIEKFYAEYNDKKSKNIQRNKDVQEKPMSDSLSIWVSLFFVLYWC